MQDVLDYYRAGIRIDQVQLQKVDPPTQVIDAFRDVQAARADQERLQNEAYSYANRIVPEARGEAERILQGARAYKEQTVAEANGQTARFLKVYEEYKKAPEVTRKRMYLETMERVLGGTDKIILDSKGGQGVVPFLPLDQLQKEARRGQLMIRALFAAIVVVVGAVAAVAYFALFIVHVNEQAIVLEFGKPVRIISEPGLFWKIPVVQTVDYFDKRILDLDTAPQEVTASDQKRIVVDAFARYRIVNPLLFYQSVRSTSAGALAAGPDHRRRRCGACSAARPSRIVVRDKREALMKRIAQQVNEEGKEFGLEVVDVRIKRADLPEQNSKNIFDRMRAERQREAAEFRAEGAGAANRIRANADREVTIIKAEATREGERTARRGRCGAQPHLRRCVQPRSRLLRLLPLDAGLRAGHEGRAIRACCWRRTASSSSTSPIRSGNNTQAPNRSDERSRRCDSVS